MKELTLTEAERAQIQAILESVDAECCAECKVLVEALQKVLAATEPA